GRCRSPPWPARCLELRNGRNARRQALDERQLVAWRRAYLALKFLQGIDVSFPTTSCNNWLGWKRPPADMEAPPHQRAAAPGFRSISLPCRASAETPVP